MTRQKAVRTETSLHKQLGRAVRRRKPEPASIDDPRQRDKVKPENLNRDVQPGDMEDNGSGTQRLGEQQQV